MPTAERKKVICSLPPQRSRAKPSPHCLLLVIRILLFITVLQAIFSKTLPAYINLALYQCFPLTHAVMSLDIEPTKTGVTKQAFRLTFSDLNNMQFSVLYFHQVRPAILLETRLKPIDLYFVHVKNIIL